MRKNETERRERKRRKVKGKERRGIAGQTEGSHNRGKEGWRGVIGCQKRRRRRRTLNFSFITHGPITSCSLSSLNNALL